MIDNITLLIHGPYSGNALEQIFKEYDKIDDSTKKRMSVILVSYVADYNATKELVEKLGMSEAIDIVQVKDVFNPGFFNINRQIVTVQAGLNKASDTDFVIKLRNDQWVSFAKLFKILDKANWLKEQSRVLSTNCFTRKDRLYHPSDMFLCGWKKELIDYYDMPLMEETHLNIQYGIIRKCAENPESFPVIFVCPEKLLFMNYLRKKAWDMQNTYEDSYAALKKHIFLVNSWDIDFRWNKKRNPMLKAGSIILPYYFTMAPFKNAPSEKARCFMRHDFQGIVTPKDIWFIGKARILYILQYALREVPHKCLYKLACWARGNGKIVYLLQHSPFWRLLTLISQKFHLQ